MTYVTIDALREAGERDVEVNGRKYRVRRVSPFKMLSILHVLPVAPDPDPKAKPKGGKAPESIELGPQHVPQLLIAGIVEPAIDEETVHLIPQEDIAELIAAIDKISGGGDPLGPSPSSNSSS